MFTSNSAAAAAASDPGRLWVRRLVRRRLLALAESYLMPITDSTPATRSSLSSNSSSCASAAACSSSGSSASSSSSTAVAARPAADPLSCAPHPLWFWLRGVGHRPWLENPIQAGVAYDLIQPGWLGISTGGIVMSRAALACNKRPAAELKPFQTLPADLAVEAEGELAGSALSCGSAYALEIPNTASVGFLRAVQERRERIKVAASSSSSPSSSSQPDFQHVRAALASWSDLELRCFILAHQRLQALHRALTAERVYCCYGLHNASNVRPNPDESGRRQFDPASDDPGASLSARINYSLHSAHSPMLVLLPWALALDGRCDRRPGPPEAAPRLTQVPTSTQTFFWDPAMALLGLTFKDMASPNEVPLPLPFFPPLLTPQQYDALRVSADPDDSWLLERGGVDVFTPEKQIAQLSSIVRGCPWPLQLASGDYPDRERGEQVSTAHRIVRLMGIHGEMAVPVRTDVEWMKPREDEPPGPLAAIGADGQPEPGGCSHVAARKWRHTFYAHQPDDDADAASSFSSSSSTLLSFGLCSLLEATLPGAFMAQIGSEHSLPWPKAVVAPVAPGWVVAIVGGSSSFR